MVVMARRRSRPPSKAPAAGVGSSALARHIQFLHLSRQRIVDVVNIFESLQVKTGDNGDDGESIVTIPVAAYFNLSADSNEEICLPSTVGRELGFSAHHAIHHMAMVKIVAPAMCHRIADRALQAHGGMGVTQDTPINHIYMTARYCQIADGPDEVHMSQLGRRTIRDGF